MDKSGPDQDFREAIVIADKGTETLTLPWASEALSADFMRVGTDLVLVSKNGDKIVIEDYFLNLQPKDLYTLGGAKISANVVHHLSGNPFAGAYAQSSSSTAGVSDPIGVITLVQGVVRVKRTDGTEDTVEAGAEIFEGDVIDQLRKIA